ncbi:MAG: DUF4406 domain-containing protein [Bacteroidales bacterium]|nr:DUF4406 domain-containing protein [Bacteroidales bacterium]
MKKVNKIYIAGKVSGLTYDIAYQNFLNAETDLKSQGDTINPLRICKSHWSWLRCMIVCIYHLITKCNRIYLLQNWKFSRGAKIEVWFAILFKKEILCH